MINRRELIVSGLAVSVLARASSAAALSSPAAAPSDRLPVRYFVADERFREALETSRAAAGSGTAILTFSADVTGLYESLDLAWRSARFAVSGMTTPGALFVLERLAWDHGFRTAYRGIHRSTNEGSVRHELFGSSELLRRMSGEGGPWASQVGRALASWRRAESTCNEPLLLSQLLPTADRATLVSWLLTPKGDLGTRVHTQT
jgi:hypothetical protein